MDKHICEMCGKEIEEPMFDFDSFLDRLQQNGFTFVESLLIGDILASAVYDAKGMDDKPDRYIPEA